MAQQPKPVWTARRLEGEGTTAVGVYLGEALRAIVRGPEAEAHARRFAASEAMEGALRGLDADWSELWPDGPDGDYRGRIIQPDEGTLEIWRNAKAALSRGEAGHE